MLASHALPGNPYVEHTLHKTLLRYFERTVHIVKQAFVDRSYRGSRSTEGCKIYLAGQRRGMTRVLKRKLKRRNAIEPIIGRVKSDGHLDQNHLQGRLGDAINALMVGAGQNLRLLFAWWLAAVENLRVGDDRQMAVDGQFTLPVSH